MDRAEHDRVIASTQQAVVGSHVLLSSPPPSSSDGSGPHITLGHHSGLRRCGARAELTAAVHVRVRLIVQPYRCTAP